MDQATTAEVLSEAVATTSPHARSATAAAAPAARPPRLPTGQERVKLLYEEYIHLPLLQQVWRSPVTDRPLLEPCFAAAFHGVELAFLLLAQFLTDSRTYVAKRPRVERLANDIRCQCQLLAELVDAELEEDFFAETETDTETETDGEDAEPAGVANRSVGPCATVTDPAAAGLAGRDGSAEGARPLLPLQPQTQLPQVPSLLIGGRHGSTLTGGTSGPFCRGGSAPDLLLLRPVRSLTQDFPFEGCPPTASAPAQSPGLRHLLAAVERTWPSMRPAERNSLIKVVVIITSAFHSSFQRWTVGLGIEHQLNTLLRAVGLPPGVPERRTNLDYMLLVQPQHVEATLTCEVYTYSEDFFFRSIHLGTECWMLVASNRIAAAQEAAAAGRWHVAASRVGQAAMVLHYLGDHVLTLTSMNLRDYLLLKVELEGTSGAGSSQVRGIRRQVTALLQPLRQAALALSLDNGNAQGRAAAPAIASVISTGIPAAAAGAGAGAGSGAAGAEDVALQLRLEHIYENPDRYPGLYNYAKALEDVESALLGGFYYKHFCLAANVIGSDAKGTMKRGVAALKATYEVPLFPVLDRVRSDMGRRFDAQLAHVKGRMMDDIISKFVSGGGAAAAAAGAATASAAAAAATSAAAAAGVVTAATADAAARFAAVAGVSAAVAVGTAAACSPDARSAAGKAEASAAGGGCPFGFGASNKEV